MDKGAGGQATEHSKNSPKLEHLSVCACLWAGIATNGHLHSVPPVFPCLPLLSSGIVPEAYRARLAALRQPLSEWGSTVLSPGLLNS